MIFRFKEDGIVLRPFCNRNISQSDVHGAKRRFVELAVLIDL